MNSGTNEHYSVETRGSGCDLVADRGQTRDDASAQAVAEVSKGTKGANGAVIANWREDLREASNLERSEKEGFEILLEWFERWRLQGTRAVEAMEVNRECAVEFWKTEVMAKRREQWQIDQWGAALRWYLRWLNLCKSEGREVRSIPERLKLAVTKAAARRGHALRTRESYGSWAARYGAFAGTESRVLDPAVAREFLSDLVQRGKRSYSTQKQALCALAFFYKNVCGVQQVDLRATRKESPRKEPVVLNVQELLALIEKLSPPYQLAAQLQAGSGLRREELVNLRIKDVDLVERAVTVRRGKGQKDRVTVVPESLVEPLTQWKKRIRKLWESDRALDRPGVALPGAMERSMSKAGERWEWFWLFITSCVGALQLRSACFCPL